MIPQDVVLRFLVFVVLVALFRIMYLPASRSFSFFLPHRMDAGSLDLAHYRLGLGPALSSTPCPTPSPAVHHRPSRFLSALFKSFCLTVGVPVLFLIPHHHPLLLLRRIRGRYASIFLIWPLRAHTHIRLATIPHLSSTREAPSTEIFSVPLVVASFFYPSRFFPSSTPFPPYRRRTLP